MSQQDRANETGNIGIASAFEETAAIVNLRMPIQVLQEERLRETEPGIPAVAPEHFTHVSMNCRGTVASLLEQRWQAPR